MYIPSHPFRPTICSLQKHAWDSSWELLCRFRFLPRQNHLVEFPNNALQNKIITNPASKRAARWDRHACSWRVRMARASAFSLVALAGIGSSSLRQIISRRPSLIMVDHCQLSIIIGSVNQLVSPTDRLLLSSTLSSKDSSVPTDLFCSGNKQHHAPQWSHDSCEHLVDAYGHIISEDDGEKFSPSAKKTRKLAGHPHFCWRERLTILEIFWACESFIIIIYWHVW